MRQFHQHRALDFRVSLLVHVRLGYPGIRIYSGRGKFFVFKRTVIPNILDILMRLLSVIRRSQLIFLSLINFSNENRRLREVRRSFHFSTRSTSFPRQPQHFHLNTTSSLFPAVTMTSLTAQPQVFFLLGLWFFGVFFSFVGDYSRISADDVIISEIQAISQVFSSYPLSRKFC